MEKENNEVVALAPEFISLASKEVIASLNREGRIPMILVPDLEIIDNESFTSSTEANILIPGNNQTPERRFTVTLDEAKQISDIQRELSSIIFTFEV